MTDPDPDPAPLPLRTAFSTLAEASARIRRLATEPLGSASTDTVFALGYTLGSIDKAKALVGRDIDDLRKLPATASTLPSHGEWWVCVHPIDVRNNNGAYRVPLNKRLVAYYQKYGDEPGNWSLYGPTTTEGSWREDWLVPLRRVNLENAS